MHLRGSICQRRRPRGALRTQRPASSPAPSATVLRHAFASRCRRDTLTATPPRQAAFQAGALRIARGDAHSAATGGRRGRRRRRGRVRRGACRRAWRRAGPATRAPPAPQAALPSAAGRGVSWREVSSRKACAQYTTGAPRHARGDTERQKDEGRRQKGGKLLEGVVVGDRASCGERRGRLPVLGSSFIPPPSTFCLLPSAFILEPSSFRLAIAAWSGILRRAVSTAGE